jgi:F0F1-type ATP synthase membrane subunit b/b'
MYKILESILSAEQDARLRVEASLKRAAERNAETDALAEAIVAQAREKASKEIKDQVERARIEAVQTYAKDRAKMLSEKKAKFAALDQSLDALAEKVTTVVLTSLVE